MAITNRRSAYLRSKHRLLTNWLILQERVVDQVVVVRLGRRRIVLLIRSPHSQSQDDVLVLPEVVLIGQLDHRSRIERIDLKRSCKNATDAKTPAAFKMDPGIQGIACRHVRLIAL